MPRYRKLHVKALESLDINDMPDDFTACSGYLLPLVCDREGAAWITCPGSSPKVFPIRL